jgi:hypothetical protein
MKSNNPILAVLINTLFPFGVVYLLSSSWVLSTIIALPFCLITIAYEQQGEEMPKD